MKRAFGLAGIGMTTLALLGVLRPEARGQAAPVIVDNLPPVLSAGNAIRDWPRHAQAVAKAMILKYGQPDDVGQSALTWRHNGPWKRTIVSRQAPTGLGEDDVLRQVVGLRVPAGKSIEIESFDRGVEVDEAREEVSSTADSEPMNFLALNLADDIASGKRDAAEARRFYFQDVMLSQAGKTRPYMQRLFFITER